MQGMIRCGLLAGFLVACHTTDPAMPDGSTPDGSASAAGMHVIWRSDPATWPASIEDNFSLDSATFAFDNLKVIGDAGPGDPRTSVAAFELRWDATTTPPAIDFADAPSGVYSKVSFQIDGHIVNPSYKLHGHVQVAGVSYSFEIDDRDAVSLSLQCDRTLDPGGSQTIPILLSFHDALASIDWSSVHNDNGELELGTTDSQMPAFRAKLTQSFQIDTSAPN